VEALTEEEQRLVEMPREFYRAFAALPQLHPSDLPDVAFHVHALSRIVAMRAAHRTHPNVVPNRCDSEL
jgi:hypothetical protein